MPENVRNAVFGLKDTFNSRMGMKEVELHCGLGAEEKDFAQRIYESEALVPEGTTRR